MPNQKICLIHWKAEEAQEKAAWLQSAGYAVDFAPFTMDKAREMKQEPPAAVVIDLSRLPSAGRDVAITLAQSPAIRQAWFVFVGGSPEKVARLRELLPEALYTTWDRLLPDLEYVLSQPARMTKVPASSFAGYSGTPLVKKLGIRAHGRVALVNAPLDFRQTLGELPAGAELGELDDQEPDLIIWFARAQSELESQLPTIRRRLGRDGLWIAWPKKTSAVMSDLSEKFVRQAGLAAGLVDYKISAIDATWSGLKFALRKTNK